MTRATTTAAFVLLSLTTPTLAAPPAPAARRRPPLLATGRPPALPARRGERLHAGPRSILIDPRTGKTTRDLVVEDPEATVVPVLHQRAPGETSLYWARFSTSTPAPAPRRDLGRTGDAVVIPDDFE